MTGEKKSDVWQGTLALIVLKTLETMGPLQGYGIARPRADQRRSAGGQLRNAVSGAVEIGAGGIHRVRASRTTTAAKYYTLRCAGHRQVEREAQEWEKTAAILTRFLSPERGAR